MSNEMIDPLNEDIVNILKNDAESRAVWFRCRENGIGYEKTLEQMVIAAYEFKKSLIEKGYNRDIVIICK